MKYFFIANVFAYALTTVIIFFYHGISFSNMLKSLQMYIMLHFSAFFSFLNFFHLKATVNIIIAISWGILVLFAYYIYKYASEKSSLQLWCIFILLWLLVGLYNPEFRA